jgi:intein-encoded DNA endonuclease-like protein
MKRKIFDDETARIICEKYDGGATSIELGKEFNVSPRIITNCLRDNDIRVRHFSESRRIYRIDEHYFANIDTEIKAYILGILYADGCNDTANNRISISQAENNKEIIEIISNILGTNVSVVEPRKTHWQKMYTVAITSKNISNDLEKHGVVPNKTFNSQFPEHLPKHSFRHFIRGYLDGDGCIYIYNNKFGRVSFIGTNNLLSEFSKIFKNILGINSSILTKHPESNNIIKELYVSGNRQILILLDWLYDKSNIHMNRKYKKYITLKNIYIKLHLPRLCSIPGCENKHYGLNFCWKHWYEHKKKNKK